jgi:hypothetical protein
VRCDALLLDEQKVRQPTRREKHKARHPDEWIHPRAGRGFGWTRSTVSALADMADAGSQFHPRQSERAYAQSVS